MPRQPSNIVGIDIGSSKVCALVGMVKEGGVIEIIGNGTAESAGLSCGVVTNIQSTTRAICQAVNEAQCMANVKINRAYVSVSSSNIRGYQIDGQISLKEDEVRERDVDDVLEEAQKVQERKMNMSECEILRVIPQEYTLDGRDAIMNPVGLCAMRMQAKAYMLSTSKTSLANINRCCSNSGVSIIEPIYSALASSYAVLSKDEKDLGVVLVDIGAGTSDIIIWNKGYPVYSAVLDYAGNLITSDISQVFSTPMSEAEKVKNENGKAMASMAEKNTTIEMSKVGSNEIQQQSSDVLCTIIEDRLEEIISQIYNEIHKSGFEEKLSAGIVLTGGTAMLPGIADKFRVITKLNTRIGYPIAMDGLFDSTNNPTYSTALGLLHFGAEDMEDSSGPTLSRDSDGGIFSNILNALREFFN